MKLIDDIRRQSEQTRRALFVFTVAVVVLVAGTFWVRRLKRDLFVLLNPDPQSQQAYAEAERASRPDPFGIVGRGLDAFRASIGGLFDHDTETPNVTPRPSISGNPHLLPLSGGR